MADRPVSDPVPALNLSLGQPVPRIPASRGEQLRPVDAQMAAIFRKLVITSRDDIIKLVPADRIGQVRSEAAKQPHRTSDKRSRPR